MHAIEEATIRRAFADYEGRLNFGWPVAGGLWTCACGWKGSSVEANVVDVDKQLYACPRCRRRDLIQYVEASIAYPRAALRQEAEPGMTVDVGSQFRFRVAEANDRHVYVTVFNNGGKAGDLTIDRSTWDLLARGIA